MLTDGKGTKWRRNIAENFNRLSIYRVHERYRQTDDKQTDRTAISYTLRIRRKFVTILSLKIPTHLNCVATLPCEMSDVLKATIENKTNKTTSVTTHFKSASSSSKADTLNIWYKNCRMWQLLWTITETINMLLHVVLKICRYRSRLVFCCCI